MNKEEAKEALSRTEAFLKIYENVGREIIEDIEKLKAIINKKDNWRDKLPQPEKEGYAFILNNTLKGLIADKVSKNSGCLRKPEHSFRTADQAELVKDKMLLMQEMHAFAHVRNEGWVPDWGDYSENKYGLYAIYAEVGCSYNRCHNDAVFGIAVKSEEIAKEMLEEFGERIEKIYNKQY